MHIEPPSVPPVVVMYPSQSVVTDDNGTAAVVNGVVLPHIEAEMKSVTHKNEYLYLTCAR